MGKKEGPRAGHRSQAEPKFVDEEASSIPKVRLQQLRTIFANAPYVCESARERETAHAEVRAIWLFIKERIL